jgi:hypothetical protein
VNWHPRGDPGRNPRKRTSVVGTPDVGLRVAPHVRQDALQRWVPASQRARVHVTIVAVCTVGLFGGLAAVVAHWS